MPGPLLMRPAPRWQVAAAFGGAIALHLAAVAIASIRPVEKVVDLSDIPEATVEMSVDTGSGAVTSAEMAQSTGSPILDNAATSAFRRWRFKPGTVSRVRTPITFTMGGASY